MKNMTYTVLESHEYNKALVIKYFCMTTAIFHVHTYSDVSNPEGNGKFNNSCQQFTIGTTGVKTRLKLGTAKRG